MDQLTGMKIVAVVCPILVLFFFFFFRKWTKDLKSFLSICIILFILCAAASFILITNTEDPIEAFKFWLCIIIYGVSLIWVLARGATAKSDKQQGL